MKTFQQDGVFNPDLYQRALRSQGYSPIDFEENLRNALLIEQLQQGLTTSVLLPQAELDQSIALMNQQRELSYITLPLDSYREKVSIDEAAITAYFEDNKDRFMNPGTGSGGLSRTEG